MIYISIIFLEILCHMLRYFHVSAYLMFYYFQQLILVVFFGSPLNCITVVFLVVILSSPLNWPKGMV